MRYDQKMGYLRLENAEGKLRNVGFVRMECWGENGHLLLSVSGVPKTFDGRVEAFLIGRDKRVTLGEVTLKDGSGRLEIRGREAQKIFLGGLEIAKVEGVRIPLPGNVRIGCDFAEVEESGKNSGEVGEKERESPEVEESGKSSGEVGEKERESPEVEESGKNSGEVGEKERESPEVEESGKNSGKVGERERESPEVEESGKNSGKVGERERESPEVADNVRSSYRRMTLKPGKWEQLDAIYPHIVPFGDQRRYLQISPGDFVIFKEKSYRRVNNSFLLHGYFSFKHLILHKMEKKGEPVYYVGVPGHYFDREKEVALLFGFESFEGRMEPAREGDFGYYMMRVEL